jgi:hypothetical protein
MPQEKTTTTRAYMIRSDAFRPQATRTEGYGAMINVRYPKTIIDSVEYLVDATQWRKSALMRYLVTLGIEALAAQDPLLRVLNEGGNDAA